MRLIISILSLLVVLGCTQKIDTTVDPPENLIQQDQMVDIVVDLLIFDAILVKKQKKKSKDVDFSKYYLHNSIMEKYSITRESFEESFSYYAHNLKVMDEIYAEAITKLSKMKDEIESK